MRRPGLPRPRRSMMPASSRFQNGCADELAVAQVGESVIRLIQREYGDVCPDTNFRRNREKVGAILPTETICRSPQSTTRRWRCHRST